MSSHQSSEEQRSTPSEASSSSQARDDLNSTQPSDATELVERLRHLACWIGDQEHWVDGGGSRWNSRQALLAAADFITQSQARATAAEGERARAFEGRKNAFEALDQEVAVRVSAQQTITQLTRELETARKVLTDLVEHARYMGSGLIEQVVSEGAKVPHAQIKAAASFLSSLSHQDEQG